MLLIEKKHIEYGGEIEYFDTIIVYGDDIPNKLKGKWVVVDKMSKKVDEMLSRNGYEGKVDLLVPSIEKGGEYGLWEGYIEIRKKR